MFGVEDCDTAFSYHTGSADRNIEYGQRKNPHVAVDLTCFVNKAGLLARTPTFFGINVNRKKYSQIKQIFLPTQRTQNYIGDNVTS